MKSSVTWLAESQSLWVCIPRKYLKSSKGNYNIMMPSLGVDFHIGFPPDCYAGCCVTCKEATPCSILIDLPLKALVKSNEGSNYRNKIIRLDSSWIRLKYLQ